MTDKKLRTLKDCYEWTDDDYEQLSEEKLREVACEWIKEIKKGEGLRVKDDCITPGEDYEFQICN